MNSFAEIRRALGRLSVSERRSIIAWMEEYNAAIMNAGRVEESLPVYKPDYPEPMTIVEFFELEAQSEDAYEYINGIIRPLSSGTVSHSEITMNLYRAIFSRLEKGPCKPYMHEPGVHFAWGSEHVVYKPDLYVACKRGDWDGRHIPSPKFVIEVLSPSTQHIDKREKAANYRRAASVEEYVIAAQKTQEVTIYRRSGGWAAERVVGRDGVVEFRSLGMSVPLAEIYDDVFGKPQAPGEMDH